MGDITGLLSRWRRGTRRRSGRSWPVVYDELRQLAAHYLSKERARPPRFQPTALVHEAYLRLAGSATWSCTTALTSTVAAAQVCGGCS
jgi:hypothetical protein